MKLYKFFKATLLFFSLFIILLNTNLSNIYAADGCSYAGQCINNYTCTCSISPENDPSGESCDKDENLFLSTPACGSSAIGRVAPPNALKPFIFQAGGGIGIIVFASRILRFLTVIAGIWIMFNFIQSGYTFITASGNVQAYQTVRDQLTWSIVGLLLIAVAYTFAGLFGLIFFGDASFIINPTIQGAIN